MRTHILETEYLADCPRVFSQNFLKRAHWVSQVGRIQLILFILDSFRRANRSQTSTIGATSQTCAAMICDPKALRKQRSTLHVTNLRRGGGEERASKSLKMFFLCFQIDTEQLKSLPGMVNMRLSDFTKEWHNQEVNGIASEKQTVQDMVTRL